MLPKAYHKYKGVVSGLNDQRRGGNPQLRLNINCDKYSSQEAKGTKGAKEGGESWVTKPSGLFREGPLSP